MVDRLDAALGDLATDVVFPETPDLRGHVLERLSGVERRDWALARWPRALVLALVSLLVLAGAAAALALLLPGLRLTPVPSLPVASVPEGGLATRLALGEPVAPGTVGAGVLPALGAPDEAYILGDHEVLSLVYVAGDGLPELDGSGIGLIVQVIDGEVDRQRVQKLVVEADAEVTVVRVGESPGFWISGPPHLIRYTTPAGAERSEATRLVGDALVWQDGDVLYRIESGLGLRETLRIAESIGD